MGIKFGIAIFLNSYVYFLYTAIQDGNIHSLASMGRMIHLSFLQKPLN